MLELYAAVQLLSQAGLEWQVDQKVQFRGAHRIFLRLFKVVRERGYYTAALEEGVALSSFISAHGREREHFGHMHMR